MASKRSSTPPCPGISVPESLTPAARLNIDSASFALESVTARMPRGVNVNWVRHLQLENENRRLPDALSPDWLRELEDSRG